jgi:hypothetical protein
MMLYPDGKAALELGNQVRRLGVMERAGRDEQDVIAPDIAVTGLHG